MYVIELESNSRGNFHAAQENSFFGIFHKTIHSGSERETWMGDADRESEVVAAI